MLNDGLTVTLGSTRQARNRAHGHARRILVLLCLSLSEQTDAEALARAPNDSGASISRYQAAVDKAQRGDLPQRALVAVPPGSHTLRVETWIADSDTISIAVGQIGEAPRDLWVTVEPELRNRCRALSADEPSDLPARIKQLLGMP